MDEIWKNIEGYEGLYQVSNLGRVRSCDRTVEIIKNGTLCLKHLKGKILSAPAHPYCSVILCKDGVHNSQVVHKLVAQYFVPIPNKLKKYIGKYYPSGLPMLELNHKDENKANNRADNLEWCTKKYNTNYGTRTAKASKILTNRKDLSIPIKMMDKEGNVIKNFPSGAEAVRYLGVKYVSEILRCCSGKRNTKTAYGYKWAYQ